MKQTLLLVVLVACKSKSSEPASKPAETKSLETKPAETKPATPKVETDDAFKASAQAVAQRHDWIVSAWGTAQLDDTPGAERWSLLSPDPKTATGDAKGAYFIQAGTTFYLVQFVSDRETAPWMGAAEPDPTWRTEAGSFIEHQQGLAGGFTRHQLAIRARDVVILRSTEKHRNENEKQTTHANLAGACTKPCPKADSVFAVTTSNNPDF